MVVTKKKSSTTTSKKLKNQEKIIKNQEEIIELLKIQIENQKKSNIALIKAIGDVKYEVGLNSRKGSC